jgi:3-dehydroquinate synthase
MENCIAIHKEDKFIYNIYITKSFNDLPTELSAFNTKSKKICIISDDIVAGLYMEEVKNVLSTIFKEVHYFIFAAGEFSKNLDTVRNVYTFLIENNFDRSDMLAALGGGVVGDLTGYTAATYLRGIDFIQIPTTLLSQVDSSIGGKTGVDFDQYKNMVGAFYQPKLVYMNVASLSTLSDSQYFSGMGEVIKHGIIKDNEYYEWLKENADEIIRRSLDVCMEMIIRSCHIKRKVVENDPYEKTGERALLNFGHTIGHAVEKLMNFNMLHGECISVGSIAASYISVGKGILGNEELEDIISTFALFNLPVCINGLSANEIILAARHDKKMESGQIKFILIKAIGNAYVDMTVSDKDIQNAIDFING